MPADLPMVRIDAVSMEQVLVNLLDNAIEYTPDGAPIDTEPLLWRIDFTMRFCSLKVLGTAVRLESLTYVRLEA